MLFFFIIFNFIVVKNFIIDFFVGFSVVIGEIGVGKLIIFDVLNLCFGVCVDVLMICCGENQVCISVIFDIFNIVGVKEYFIEEGFGEDEECSICWIINNNGCLKVFINGYFVMVF